MHAHTKHTYCSRVCVYVRMCVKMSAHTVFTHTQKELRLCGGLIRVHTRCVRGISSSPPHPTLPHYSILPSMPPSGHHSARARSQIFVRIVHLSLTRTHTKTDLAHRNIERTYPTMPVLKTTSPAMEVSAPKDYIHIHVCVCVCVCVCACVHMHLHYCIFRLNCH